MNSPFLTADHPSALRQAPRPPKPRGGSAHLRNMQKSLMPKTCPVCREQFFCIRFHAAVYCSSTCRSTAWRRSHGLATKPPPDKETEDSLTLDQAARPRNASDEQQNMGRIFGSISHCWNTTPHVRSLMEALPCLHPRAKLLALSYARARRRTSVSQG
jgi:hypothetical protein